MQRQLYPASCIENSLEAHLARFPSGGYALYCALVLATLAAGAALPLISVRIAVRGSGIIRPVVEKQAVRSRVAGLVERVLVTENQPVRLGDTIATFRAAAVDDRLSLLSVQLGEKARLARDLERLTSAGTSLVTNAPSLETADYRREYGQLVNELRDNRLTLDRATHELDRVRALHARHFATSSDLDDAALQQAHAKAQGALIIERYRSQWQNALTAVRAEMQELASQREQARTERAMYTVTAPIAGTLEQVASLSPGSYVQAGEQLAIVSPSTALVAEVYVTPRDIALLHRGTPVRMLIDAFDYTAWGVVTGSVSAISSDFVQVDGQPMFKVTCALARRRVTLGTGVAGELGKGMTLQAHFLVARRTLFQLLFDDVSDWLDPARTPARSPSGTRAAGGGSAS